MTAQHWTNRDVEAFAYAVASNFVAQVETKLDSENVEDKTFAKLAKVSPAYISRILGEYPPEIWG